MARQLSLVSRGQARDELTSDQVGHELATGHLEAFGRGGYLFSDSVAGAAGGEPCRRHVADRRVVAA